MGRLISFWRFSSLFKEQGGGASLSRGNFSFLSCPQLLASVAFKSLTVGGSVFSLLVILLTARAFGLGRARIDA